MPKVVSKCINCQQMKPCLKIEMRAPLPQRMLVWSDKFREHLPVDYETHGPMVEVCRECCDDPIVQRTIITALVEDL